MYKKEAERQKGNRSGIQGWTKIQCEMVQSEKMVARNPKMHGEKSVDFDEKKKQQQENGRHRKRQM